MQEETDNIVLNALDLVIKNSSVTLNGNTEEATDILFCSEQETVTLKFPNALPAGSEGVLNVSFSGNLNDKMKGEHHPLVLGSD